MPSLVQRRTELVGKKSNNHANHKTKLVDCVQIDAVLALIIMEWTLEAKHTTADGCIEHLFSCTRHTCQPPQSGKTLTNAFVVSSRTWNAKSDLFEIMTSDWNRAFCKRCHGIAWNPGGRKKQEKLETLENFGKQASKQAGEDIGSLSARRRRIKEAADLSLVQCVLLLESFFKFLLFVLQLSSVVMALRKQISLDAGWWCFFAPLLLREFPNFCFLLLSAVL